MTEVVYGIGPYDLRLTVEENDDYRESRTIADIEAEIEIQPKFSYSKHLRDLISIFTDVGTLEILDAGCGTCETLGGIKLLSQQIGRPIRTTGLTLAVRHIEDAQRNVVDELIIGNPETLLGEEYRGRFHHILDFAGATHWDKRKIGAENYLAGRKYLPIYLQILVPGGTLLIVASDIFDGQTAPFNALVQKPVK